MNRWSKQCTYGIFVWLWNDKNKKKIHLLLYFLHIGLWCEMEMEMKLILAGASDEKIAAETRCDVIISIYVHYTLCYIALKYTCIQYTIKNNVRSNLMAAKIYYFGVFVRCVVGITMGSNLSNLSEYACYQVGTTCQPDLWGSVVTLPHV